MRASRLMIPWPLRTSGLASGSSHRSSLGPPVWLARPVGADQAGDLPGADGEADLIEDPSAGQRHADPADAEDLRRDSTVTGLVHHSFWVDTLLATAFWRASTSASIHDW